MRREKERVHNAEPYKSTIVKKQIMLNGKQKKDILICLEFTTPLNV